MIRTLDAAPFHAIASDPEVRPWLGFGVGPIDLSPLVGNPDNHCLLTPNRDGGYVLHRLDHGLYAAHTLSLKSARGRPMFELMREGFAYMFTATDAVEIVTLVPDGNDQGRRWTERAGFRQESRREAFFPLMDNVVGASFWTMGYRDWTVQASENAEAASALRLDGPQDGFRDHWIGATLRGVAAGNAGKAVALYNRWAALARYPPALVLGQSPAVVELAGYVLGMTPNGLQVLHGPDPA